MTRYIVAISAALAAAGAAPAAVQTKVIDYEYEGTKLKGFLAWDDSAKTPRPGVLVFPEWWGLNEYTKNRARGLAEMGYVAFAADLYGGGKVIATDHPKDAMESVTTLRKNQAAWRGRATAALKVLASQPGVDPKKLAAIGYCFGGSTALQLAFAGADLKAVATFHAALPVPTPEEVKAIKPQLLVCTGAADKGIPPKAVEAFKAALEKGGVKPHIVSFPGVVHSFTVAEADKVGNENMKYNRDADAKSWQMMKELFHQAFAK